MSAEDFTKDISLVTPVDFVNNEVANTPLIQLQNNLQYVLNFLNGNKLLLPAVFGNLFDFNKDGKRILYNGGSFDSQRKCHTWTSLTSSAVSNDTEIAFDSTNSNLVYRGQSLLTDSREKWIEREIFVPEMLRDQEILVSIKASGCSSADFDINNAVAETVAFQILGGAEDVQDFAVMGPWDNFDYYTNDVNLPAIRTHHISVLTARNTKSLKIKILRTVNSNYLHINKIYLGAVTMPYSNYSLNNMDINELYDFNNAITKVTSTGVMGHKVAESYEKAKGSDLVTFEQLSLLLQQCICGATPGTSGTSGTPGTSGTSGTPGTNGSCECLGPPGALTPPIDIDPPTPNIYPNIFNYGI
jgi:hypothetical protein